jgi:hypothetical protein
MCIADFDSGYSCPDPLMHTIWHVWSMSTIWMAVEAAMRYEGTPKDLRPYSQHFRQQYALEIILHRIPTASSRYFQNRMGDKGNSEKRESCKPYSMGNSDPLFL